MRRAQLERMVAELAEAQWGLLTAAQARAVAVSRVELTRLVQDGMLTRLAHGVYVVRGAAGMDNLELRAAWLGLDPERMAADRLRKPTSAGVVSHASAARLHQLGDLEADRYEFTLPTRKQSRRSDVRLHRGTLTANEVMTVAGLPVATPERIIVDLLDDRHDGDHVARVLASAVGSRAIDLDRLAPRLARFAARFDFRADEGDKVLGYLIELGGAADQVVADSLVSTARATNTDVIEIAQAMSALRTSPVLAETARVLQDFASSPVLAEIARTANTLQTSRALVEMARAANTLQASRVLVETARVLQEFASSPVLAEIARTANSLQTNPAFIEAVRSMSAAARETHHLEQWRVLEEDDGPDA